MLDVSRPLIGADVMENRGINGQNITIGQVEVGGRVLNSAAPTSQASLRDAGRSMPTGPGPEGPG